VKSLTPDELQALGAQCILANTYHLVLRHGAELIASLGGLHRFMGWPGPILTDSGGFQVFSLAPLRRVADDGVVFRSHIDGSEHWFTPEGVVAIEEQLGADVIMVLDECVPYPSSREATADALRRTHRWAERCRAAQRRPDQALFAIVQGGTFPDLRVESARTLVAMDFPGYAIGGLSVGEPKDLMWRLVEETVAHLPAGKPRYLMGVGSPEDLVEGVARGVDLFDCVLPTRVARNGALFTPTGRVNLRNARFRGVDGPIFEGCACFTCQRFSTAYLHHLFRAEELLAYRLATLHNLHFVLDLMRRLRAAILDGTFAQARERFLATWTRAPEAVG
ncbi:MAG TPA: tRNA guanosine(34) transglycosylase Tgt, partial [Chloroflexota bacterium]